MAMFTNVVSRAQDYLPAIRVKYKDESTFMKILGKIVFFNPKFMSYTTTIGSTVYLPSAAKLRSNPVSSTIIFMHEVSHILMDKKLGMLFKPLYLFPQVLALLAVPAFFIFPWYAALCFLLFILPLPAYFRMKEEKQAYIVSLYVMNKLNQNRGFNIDLEAQKNSFVEEFGGSSYYFMWPFPGVKESFDVALEEIKSGGKPNYDPGLYEIINNILEG